MGAGKASRMGQDKLAMPWGNTSILGYVLDTILKALSLDRGHKHEVFVVARKPINAYVSEVLVEELNSPRVHLRWIQLLNPQPLSDTIHAGLRNLSEKTNGICFIPGDQVGLLPEVLAELTAVYLRCTPDFLVPQAGNLTGSPVFFHPRYLSELKALEGEQGGKGVLSKYQDRWMTYPVPTDFLQDVDTREEYETYRKGEMKFARRTI